MLGLQTSTVCVFADFYLKKKEKKCKGSSINMGLCPWWHCVQFQAGNWRWFIQCKCLCFANVGRKLCIPTTTLSPSFHIANNHIKFNVLSAFLCISWTQLLSLFTLPFLPWITVFISLTWHEHVSGTCFVHCKMFMCFLFLFKADISYSAVALTIISKGRKLLSALEMYHYILLLKLLEGTKAQSYLLLKI